MRARVNVEAGSSYNPLQREPKQRHVIVLSQLLVKPSLRISLRLGHTSDPR